jgi:hypothetical protein
MEDEVKTGAAVVGKCRTEDRQIVLICGLHEGILLPVVGCQIMPHLPNESQGLKKIHVP